MRDALFSVHILSVHLQAYKRGMFSKQLILKQNLFILIVIMKQLPTKFLKSVFSLNELILKCCLSSLKVFVKHNTDLKKKKKYISI